jgi:PREDICTED: similar to CREB/ATF family transcription factor
MSSNNAKSSVTSEKTTEENDLPLELTTITLYTEDSKNNSNYSATINAFEIHNYSCNSRPDYTKGNEDLAETGDGKLNHSMKNSNINRKVNSQKSSKSRALTDFKLTEEEKRLLVKEGYSNFPTTKASLTKQDVKILRKIRRKIRNKRSAQCSRQRKKQYLEDLEKKFEECTNERDSLKQEVSELRKENQTLLMKMQKMISKNYSSHGQASYKTSLFVLIISFLFILMPYFR